MTLRDYFWPIFGISTALKILLIPAYHSTDFEVHRNWLAITHSLPLQRWYVDATSEWTLDYPPFFAYFEWLLSQLAQFVDPRMLDVQNLNYASQRTVYFQRLTVICADLIYALGVRLCLRALGVGKQTQQHLAGCLLLLLNVGLIFVDHIHFQYNGLLFGILLLSISALFTQRYLWGAFLFATLLNFKHIFLYIAPAFGVYYLRFYCFELSNNMTQAVNAMLKLLVVGLTPFVLSFGPFWQQIPQVFSRLFPFKRGLTHAYWAPNLWALYNTADKFAASALQRKPANAAATTTSGLVQELPHVVLPSITPGVTFALTLLFMLPILIKLLNSTKKQSRLLFLRAIVLCACSSFIFGWHVHEKAILMCLIPLCLLALLERTDAKYAFLLSVPGYFSLFPLLFQTDLLIMRYSLYLAYIAAAHAQLMRIYRSHMSYNLMERLYFVGFIAIPIYEHLLSSVLGLNKRLPFMPLLLTSVYAALGVLYFFVGYYLYALDFSWACLKRERAVSKKTFSIRRKRKTK